MSALPLFAALPRPPDLRERGIDLRCCDTAEMLASLPDGCADLVIEDPPWDYVQATGATRADNHYTCMRVPRLAEIASMSARLSPLKILWCTWPLMGEWTAARTAWGPIVTGGTWTKSEPDNSGHFGQGYWWSGCSEPFLLYKSGIRKPHRDLSVPIRNAWTEAPGLHSRKPVALQADWIRRFVPPGGLVVDVYAGLASVAEAVLLAGEGRRYVGAEIDPERHAAALSLLAQVRA